MQEGRTRARAPGQLALPLASSGKAGEEFLVGPSNAAAVRHLEHHATWPVRASVLAGPRGSGRTMLGRLFERATGGTLLDDVGTRDDEEIFHAWNRAQESRKPLLMVAETDPARWKVALPDLRSRLMAAPVVRIEEPDDALAIALIERLFLDRATPVAPDLPAYLIPRIERSYAAIHGVVTEIDRASLAQKKRIGVRLAREILFDTELIGIARRPGGGSGRRGG